MTGDRALATSARGAAARLVFSVTAGDASLADQIAAGALAALAPPDRARAQRLALTTLRNIARADRLLKPFLRKPPPHEVRAILRTAVTELFVDGAPAHGVVGEAVDLTRRSGPKGAAFAPMVNAVLRRAGESDLKVWASAPPQELPGWLRGRFMSAWGKKATMTMEAAHAKGAPLDLTPKDGDAERLANRLGGVALPTGSVRLADAGQVSDLPGYAEGDWWVQDAAAALAARVLNPRRGERILDLCAAPGGKTLQLAAAGAIVTALDVSAARMDRLKENLARCRLTAETVVADALTWTSAHQFDAILLDAPCSATGTIRRHPDLPYLRDASALKAVFALQAALLDHAIELLRPDGRLVFATCSLLPDEGEKQIEAALSRHPSLAQDATATARPGIAPEWITGTHALRLRPDFWPNIGGMDGFFIAGLTKAG